MSLINDMLNDLDERRVGDDNKGVDLGWMAGQRKSTRKAWLMPLIFTLIVGLLLALAYSLWMLVSRIDQPALDQFQRATQSPNTKVIVVDPPQENIVVTLLKKEIVTPIDAKFLVAEKKIIAVEISSKPEVVTLKKIKEPATIEKIHSPAESKQRVVDNNPAGKKSAAVKIITDVKISRPLTLAQRDMQKKKIVKALLRQQNFSEAETQLQIFLQQYPQAIHSSELLAALWIRQQQYVKAEQLLLTMKNYNASSIGLLMTEAHLYLLTNRTDKSVRVLMSRRPGMRSHSDYYELLGLAARQNKQYSLSARTYESLLEFDDSRGDWWVGLAIALDIQQQTAAAKEAYRHALGVRLISPALKDYAQQRLAGL